MSFSILKTLRHLRAVNVHHKFAVRTIKTASTLNSVSSLKHSPNAKLSKTIIDKFLCLPLPECVSIVEYVWIDGTGKHLRSKSRTLRFVPDGYKEVPLWSYDGCATYQEIKKNTDIQLVPVALYKCPFRRGNNRIVLCEAYTFDGCPAKANNRVKCREVLNQVCEHEVMWGLEQEYQLMDVDGRPFGWPVMLGEPRNFPGYYCSVGADKSYGGEIAEAHYRACLYAGVQLAGSNSEVTLSQWEYQIGICSGIKGADDLWIARYIMDRIAEEYGVDISLEPKLFPNWNGAGCHANFSTKSMRADNGIKAIIDAIGKLKSKHSEHLAVYDTHDGEYNKKRLTGGYEAPKLQEFTQGIGDRTVSVRISNEVAKKKKGYFEDRRPSANVDPYQLCERIIRTCLL